MLEYGCGGYLLPKCFSLPDSVRRFYKSFYAPIGYESNMPVRTLLYLLIQARWLVYYRVWAVVV